MKILNRIRYYLFSRRQRRQQDRVARFPVYEQVHTILLIYDSDVMEKNADIRELVRRLMQDEIQVSLIGFVDRKEAQSPILPQSRMLAWNNCTLFHTLRKDVEQDMLKDEYDLLIDLTQQSCLPLHYVALFTRARFKAGKHIVDGLHDLEIEMPTAETHTPLFDQIIHYLQTIKSND